jgi:hypothetical protein
VSATLVIQHAKHMCHIMSFVVHLAVLYFSTLSDKWHNFRENVEQEVCVLIFSTTFI